MASPKQSADIARSWRQQRFNPLRTITPQLAGAALDQWDAGYLRSAAMMWEEIEARDGKAVVVCEKRRSKVTRCEWDVLIGEEVEDKDRAEAERQQQELKRFYSRLRTFSSVDLDVEGGVKLLIERTMDAKLCHYSAFETVWSGGMRRGRGELKCDLWHVPNYFLEKTTGKLRFAGVNGGPNGKEMPRENWMVAVGRPLMKAVTVSYIFKRLSLADWLNFSEKFGIPGVHKETMAKPGSPEWEQGLESLAGFANDWMIQTTQGEKINLIQAGMSGDGPFAPMVERMDREITSIIMGADLATMSRADGAGASLQGDETDDLIDGDCEWVSEVFQRRLDARVLEWHFGVGVEPLAFFKLSPPSNVDIEREMKVDDHVTKFGVKLSVADLAERYARSHDEAAEEIKPESEKKDEEQEPEQEKEDPAAGNAFDPDKHERDNLGRWAKKDVSDGAKATKGNKATRGEMREGTDEDYKRLKIPPRKIITDKDGKEKITGYADLQVTDDPESDVLGVALDPKGEAKPFYSANWEEKQAAIKWARLRELHKDMPEIKEQWDADIADPSSKNHQEALAMRLMYKSGLRIGGKDGGGKVESFGATSLKTEHVRVDGDKVHLDFTGKKGVRQQHTVTDPDLAKWATARQASGAERLFDTNDAKTRDYSNKIGGDKYRVHDLRDYNGTMLAQATVNKLRAKGVTMPDAGKAQDDYKMRVAKVVGRQLGNDPKMSLKAYISPAVWKDAEMTKKMPKPMRGSDGEPQKRKAA